MSAVIFLLSISSHEFVLFGSRENIYSMIIGHSPLWLFLKLGRWVARVLMWSVEEIVMNDASVWYMEQACMEYVRSLNWAALLMATAGSLNGNTFSYWNGVGTPWIHAKPDSRVLIINA